MLDDTKRFGRVNWLIKSERDVSLFLIDLLLSERREQDEDLGTRSEQAWWRVWQRLKGKAVDLQYVVPEYPGNMCDHLRIIETLELAFALEHALATPEGKQLLSRYGHEIKKEAKSEITYAA